MLPRPKYYLAKTYFDILNSLTHGKHKLPMTYYPYFKTMSSTKFMGTMLISSIRNSNYKAYVYYSWQNYSFCKD